MAGFGDEVRIEAGVDLNRASLDDFTEAITAAIIKGLKGLDVIPGKFQKAAKGANSLGDELKSVNKSMHHLEDTGVMALSQISREVVGLVRELKKVTESTRIAASAISKTRTIERQEAIRTTSEINNQARLEREQVKNTARLRYVELQNQGAAARDAARRRTVITQQMFNQLTHIEKALGAVIAGVARTSVAAVSRTMSGVGSIFSRSNRQVTEGLSGSLKNRESQISRSFSSQERILRESVTRQTKILGELNQRASTGVAGAVTGRGVGGGLLGPVAAGVGVGALLSAGFQRFSDLERINKQFIALTGNVDEANALLAESREFAKTTPFDLVGVADLAKGFLSIGTASKDVIPRVKAISDAVALTGGGTDALNRIQRAIGQIVSTGKLQGDELNQLAENLPGLNIRKILADQITGGNVQELARLQEAGELSADLVVNGLITGLQNDPRIAGASEDLAKTLSGRVANLKESFADLGASIIGLIAGPLAKFVVIIQTGIQSLGDFLKGENLGPVLATLRRALFGVAAGMLAIVAAKAAVEVIKLLGVAAKLALTPFGLLLTVAGLLGAAFAVLYDKSIPFREAVNRIATALVPVVNFLRDLATGVLNTLTDVLVQDVLPALEGASVWLAERVLPAFKAVASFVLGTFIPAFLRIGTTIIGGIVNGFHAAIDAIKSFWAVLDPLLRPAIEGIHELANAIGALFTGDQSNIRDAAGNAIGGVGAAAGNIIGAIGEVLAPVGQAIFNFFRDLFTPDKVNQYISGLLDFIETVGRILGTIVSDPIIFKVLAGIAAAAAVIAFRFLKGVIEGIASNIPELAALLGDALKALLKLAFDNLLVTAGLLLAGLFIAGIVRNAKAIQSAFQTAGQAAGGGFAAGLKASASNAGGFLSTLVKGPGLSANNSAIAKASAEAFDLQRQLRMLGSTTKIDLLTPGAIAKAKTEVENLSKGLSSGQMAALRLRDSIGIAVRTFGTFGDAAKVAASGFKAAGSEFRNSFGLQRALSGPGGKDSFSPLAQNAHRAMNAIRTEAKTAFGGVGEGLKTVGKVGASAFDTLRIKGMYAMDAVKRESKVAFGGVVEGWRSAAKSIRGAVDTGVIKGLYAMDTLRGTKVMQLGSAAASAFSSGWSRGMSGLKAGFAVGMEGLRTAANEAGTTVGKLVGRAMATAGQGALAAAGGFAAGKFVGASGGGTGAVALTALTTGLATGFAVGGPAGAAVGVAAGAFTLLGAAIGKAGRAAKLFKEDVARIVDGLKNEMKEALDDGTIALDKFREGLIGISDVANFDTVRDAFVNALGKDGVKALNDVGLAWATDIRPILEEGGDADTLKKKLSGAFADSIKVTDEFTSRFGTNAVKVKNLLQEVIRAQGGMGTLKLWAQDRGLGDVISDNEDFVKNFIDTAGDLVSATDETVTALDEFNQATKFLSEPGRTGGFTSAISAGVAALNAALPKGKKAAEGLQETIDGLGEAASRTLGSMASLFSFGGDNPIQLAVDNALMAVDGIGARIAESLQKGGPVGGAEVNTALNSIGAQIGAVVQAGVDQGLIFDGPSADAFTKDIRDAAIAGLDANDPAQKAVIDRIGAAYALAVSKIAPTIDEAKTIEAAAQFQRQVQKYLNENPTSTVVTAEIAVKKSNEIMGDAAGRKAVTSGKITLPASVKVDAPTESQVRPGFFSAGLMAARGLADGIKEGKYLPKNAAARMAAEIIATVKSMMKIFSPSKVFIGIGGQVAAGLAEGISDGASDAASSAASMVNSVVQAAVNAASNGQAAVMSATSALFGAMTGAASPGPGIAGAFDLTNSISAITNANQSLNSTVASNAQALMDASSTPAGKRDAAQKNLIGESFVSLNPADVLGASNLSAVQAALGSITEYGKALLSGGEPVGSAIKKVQQQVDAFVANAVKLGFNKANLLKLIDMFGLAPADLASFASEASNLTNLPSTGARTTLPPIAIGGSTNTTSVARTAATPQVLPSVGAATDRVGPQNITLNLYLPTGDPEANALAVANRIAALV